MKYQETTQANALLLTHSEARMKHPELSKICILNGELYC